MNLSAVESANTNPRTQRLYPKLLRVYRTYSRLNNLRTAVEGRHTIRRYCSYYNQINISRRSIPPFLIISHAVLMPNQMYYYPHGDMSSFYSCPGTNPFVICFHKFFKICICNNVFRYISPCVLNFRNALFFTFNYKIFFPRSRSDLQSLCQNPISLSSIPR